ncbi:hypothetical protein LR010_01040 [Candidatus Gracilibacteria bacterium]|nr:hypothetical protein [Candidatus Gracilibacteria bacterium]
MKKIFKDKIINIQGTDTFDNTFLFEYYVNIQSDNGVEIIYLRDLLKSQKNIDMLERVKEKPAMYSEVYSPKDEIAIFTELFETAISENKKIHIVGVTLLEEVKMLEAYYEELGFMREDINAFDVDFSVPLVTVSCHIENLMWRGSDYKAQRDNIFFCPPIRESGQNKAIFKGITRGVIAGIELGEFTPEKQEFIGDCIRGEKVLPLHMGKVLKYNLEEIGLDGNIKELQVEY